jgi:hypothetical protein
MGSMLFVVSDPEVRDRRFNPGGCGTRVGGIFVFFGAVGLAVAVLVIRLLSPGADLTSSEQQFGLAAIGRADYFARTEVTQPPSAAVPPEEGPIYAVQPLANVDSLTAGMTLESILVGGFSGFVMDGSDSEGYDVYLPGLEFEEAFRLETELIASGIIPEYSWVPKGFYVVESDSLR